MDEQASSEVVDLPEPLSSTTDPSHLNFSEPPVEPLQAGCCGTDPSLSNLPEPPEEPLPSDCCGTGCSPCVFDIYQEDLAKWKVLANLTPEERAIRLQKREKELPTALQCHTILNPDGYQAFEVTGIDQVSSDAFVYRFGLPGDAVLGVGVGQHAILRCVCMRVVIILLLSNGFIAE